MITSPKVALNTRSLSPLTARAWRIRKSWRWKTPLASGLITRVSVAVTMATSTAQREDRPEQPERADARGLEAR